MRTFGLALWPFVGSCVCDIVVVLSDPGGIMAVKAVSRWKRKVGKTDSEKRAQKVFAGSP